MDDRRADLLRAFEVLKPDADDDATRHAMAALFGLRWLPRQETPQPAAVTKVEVSNQRRVEPSTPAALSRPPVALVERPATALPEPFVLKRTRAAERRPPRWVDEATPLPRLDPRATQPLPVDPLINPLQARAILSGTLARHTPDGPVDVPRVVEQVARGEAIRNLPRQRVPSIARGVQLLVDRSEAMSPYAADVTWLTETMRKVVGSYALDVMHFADSPLRAAGRGPRRTWKPYQQLLPPRIGATVVAVTDLGIRPLPPPASPASQDEWVALADYVDRFGCPLVALVPYGPHRWPRRLRRRFAIVTWDRPTTAAKVRGALTRGLP